MLRTPGAAPRLGAAAASRGAARSCAVWCGTRAGRPWPGRRVTVDPPAGPSVTTSADGTFSFEAAGEGGSGRRSRLRRGRGHLVGHGERPARWCCGPRGREEVTVTAGRTPTRLGDTAERVIVLGPGGHRRERRADPRRHAAAGAGVQPVPAVGQPGRQPHLPGRVASRRGAERSQPDARPPRRRALERRLRGLGLLEPRASRRDRAGRGPGGRGLRPLRQRGARGRRPGPRPQGRERGGARRLARKRGDRGRVRVRVRAERAVERARGRRGLHHRGLRPGGGRRARARRRRGGGRAPERLAGGRPAPVALGHGLRAGLAPRREPGERHAAAGERHGLPAGERRSGLERESGRASRCGPGTAPRPTTRRSARCRPTARARR